MRDPESTACLSIMGVEAADLGGRSAPPSSWSPSEHRFYWQPHS